MKKIFLLLAILVSCNFSAQITLDHSTLVTNANFGQGGFLDKFHVSGYKYVVSVGGVSGGIDIYNLNHTLFKTITVPIAFAGGYYFISENLFDLDNGVEYLVWRYSFGPTYTTNISILDESGAVLFTKDSASLGGIMTNQGTSPNIFMNQDPVYYDGTGVKLKLAIWNQYNSTGYKRTDIYNLPGTIPCNDCTAGITTLMSNPGSSTNSNAEFFPNPVADQLKLKYKLPAGSHLAEMKIYDTQGKLVDEFKITDHYDFIYLPTNYNNGLYLYSLIVDGKIIKTEKIVLNK
ncbi:MAG: T9SS type A sorting domain-containing protein [Bacteroidia bacterium]|nr:T9SS type A sorting domain-containing protein [Bacteroidia bacterium]